MNYFSMPGMKEHPAIKIGRKNPDHVIRAITKHYGVELEDIKRKNRKRHICECRFLIMYYLYNECNMTLNDIADMLAPSVTHHTTVLHGIQFVRSQKTIPDSDISNVCKMIAL